MEYSYFDTFRNETLRFDERTPELLVRFESQTSWTHAFNFALDKGLALGHGFDPVGAIGSFRDDRDLPFDAKLLDLQTSDDRFRGAVPVLIDDQGNERRFLPDEITVLFRPEVSPQQAEEFIVSLGSRVVVRQRIHSYYTVGLLPHLDLFETIERFLEHEHLVEHAAPSEFGLDDFANTTPTEQELLATEPLQGLRIAEAWELRPNARGHRDVVIAVIDNLVDHGHPDLKSQIFTDTQGDSWDFRRAPCSSCDDKYHGTRVAGVVSAAKNGTGTLGIAPGCSLMPLRIKPCFGGTYADRADAIDYVRKRALTEKNQGRRYVINCSWLLAGHNPMVVKKLREAAAQGVVVVCAAGNNAKDLKNSVFPAVLKEVITVTGLEDGNVRWSGANFGKKVDVAAPAVRLWTTARDKKYGEETGTSVAAPLVAGLAGMLWSADRSLTAANVRKLIEDHCDPIDSFNPNHAGKLGKGRINPLRSMNAL